MRTITTLLAVCLLVIGFDTGYAQSSDTYNTLLYDDFYDNSNQWATSDHENATMTVSGGNYYFEHKRSESSWLSYKKIDAYNSSMDFVLEAKIEHISGIDNNGFGIVFGRKDNENQYEFFISANGYYMIKEIRNDQKTYISDWTLLSALNKGNYSFNTLRLECKNNLWSFYINNVFLTSTSAREWFDKRIGFVVYKNQKMAVDYISFKQILPKQIVNNYNNNQNNYSEDKPIISIYEPQSSRGYNVVKAKTVRVAGKAVDANGIYEVKINGADVKFMADGYFTTDVPLAPGQNTITIVATDTRRQSTTKVIEVKREDDYNNVNNLVNNNVQNQNQNQNQNQQYTKPQKRLALVIGNSAYLSGASLSNPVNDARAMKTTLEQIGFTVLKYENCSQKDLRKAMDDFGQQLAGYDVGLFFYAGHGIAVDGNNYLVPIDATLKTKNDVEYDCVDAGRILSKMEASQVKTNIVILDACRDNPFERSWSRSASSKGLAFMNAPSGSFVAYATSPGMTASDGVGANGLYTSALLEQLVLPGLTIEQVFKNVRTNVKQKSGGKQVPWESTSLEGTFMFKP
jgi:hypothetical protein